jgi:hypothetical protein
LAVGRPEDGDITDRFNEKAFRPYDRFFADVDPNDAVAVALSGNIGEMPDSSVKMMAETASMLREIGVRESIIEETLRGHEVTQQEYDLAAAWKARQMKDPVFVKAYRYVHPWPGHRGGRGSNRALLRNRAQDVSRAQQSASRKTVTGFS